MSSVRRAALAVYAPSVLYGVGAGAVLPVLALTALDLGASLGVAGAVVASLGVGQILGAVPAGALAARVGERAAMIGSTLVLLPALVGCALAPSVGVLAACTLLLGATSAVWGLARQAYLTEVVPLAMRARALSTLGGSHRIGMFVGPFVGAWAISVWDLTAAYWVHVVAAGLACLVLLTLPEVPDPEGHRAARAGVRRSVASVARDHLGVLLTLGTGVAVVGAVRGARQVALPLWSESIGLDAAQTSLVFGVAGAVDMLLFYPAGKVMDRFGRVWVAVPSMVVLGLSFLLLPLAHGVPALTAVALLMGLGNGIGSGIVMTLGADTAPPDARPQYLGAWRLCADAGAAAGPLLLSGVAALTALAPALVAVGGLGLAGAAWLGRHVPRHDPTRRTTSALTSPAGRPEAVGDRG